MKPRHHRDPTRYPKHHRRSTDRVIHPVIDVEKVRDIDDVLKGEIEPKEKIYSSTKNKSTMYPAKSEESPHDSNQNVTVTVTVNEPQQDCMASCFSSIAKCFGKS